MLALLAKAEYPKPPVDLQIQIGWLALLALTLISVWVWTRAESVRRSIFAREDPRMFALFRIGLGVITIQNFWNLLMHWRMLWTDEGMFTHEETHARLGRAALVGWTETDGFFDGWAVLKFFWGKFSLLYFDSSPEFVKLYLVLLFGALALYTIGFRTRVTGWLCLLLVFSLYNRNGVYLEGHDTVFKCMWFATVFAKTDAAWSVDNWIRRWRERHYKAQIDRGKGVPLDRGKFLDLTGHWLWGGLWAWLFCAKVGFTAYHVNLVVVAGIQFAFWRCWFERQRLLALAERGKLELPEPARFQLIPAWPRYIIIAQLVCIYFATGLYKTGSVWKAGDALYYAMNMDHFFRFEGFTQWISVYLGTNVFRLMSLVTWWWEKLFPLIIIGLILDFGLRHRDAPWYKAQDAVWWRKWLGRLALIGSYAVIYRLVIIAYPWCLELQKDKTPTPADAGLQNLHVWFGAILPIIVLAWFVLGRWPLRIPRLVRRLRDPKASEASGNFVINQRFVRDWLLGRRVWLGVGLIFHGMLIAFMNIGMFPVIMMWVYVAYFEARPYLKFFRWLSATLRKSKWTAWLAPRVLDPAFGEEPEILETAEASVRRDPTGPWWLDPWKLFAGPVLLLRARKREALLEIEERGRTRGGTIPDALVLALGGLLVLLVSLRGLEAQHDPLASSNTTKFVGDVRELEADQKQAEAKARKQRIDRLGDAAHWWAYSVLGFAAVSHFRRRRRFDQLDDVEPVASEKSNKAGPGKTEAAEPVSLATPAIMGGTVLRTIALGFVLYHCSAVAAGFIPDYPITNAWRGEVSKVYGDWVRGTNQQQSWKMFAPNPPQGNTFMHTVVVDQDDKVYQVGEDHYHGRPYVFWYNDRMRKMHRRMSGKSKWYLRYWGQYHCRDWAFNHDGQLPKEVRVFKLRTPIPKPEEVRDAGVPSDPRKRRLRKEKIQTHTCTPDVITPEMKQRRGWPLTDADQRILDNRPKRAQLEADNKRSNWDKRQDFGGQEKNDKDDAGK